MVRTRSGGVVEVEQRADVVVIRLNRPERKNALTQEVMDLMREVCAEIADDPDVRAVVITGAGGAFCAGLDLEALGSGDLRLDGSFCEAVRGLPYPTIAAVDGPAITGGLELALACDMRLGSSGALLADTHVRVGVPPGGGASATLPRVVGVGRAKEISLSGRIVFAEEAERWGLLNRIVPEPAVDSALELARTIAANDRATVAAVRDLIDSGLDVGHSDALELERVRARQFAEAFDSSQWAPRRSAVVARNRTETHADPPGPPLADA
ncbi:enoyl-CoA hydratase/isomerase family protein [Georgenia sp. SYP-B2076]|uniref:enoyl-CoA hydratase/isomerase family protein n=1 Tax=Georgenia sp. SYP-B2076 TaxID=2495881 RepID=UPI000F8EA48A|nr:enoyl-CoA hydratase-related protein [Georgenia sp. SYP-B2076]